VYHLTEVKVNTEGMTAEDLAILRIQKETRIAQAQEFIKPHFINGIKRELRPQLPSIFQMNLRDMVKELSRWESFQEQHLSDKQHSYVAMIEREEIEPLKPHNVTLPVPVSREEEVLNEMIAEFVKWLKSKTQTRARNLEQ
jgi:hypothetical protein